MFPEESRAYPSETRTPSHFLHRCHHSFVLVLSLPQTICSGSEVATSSEERVSNKVRSSRKHNFPYWASSRRDYYHSHLSDVLSMISASVNAFVFIAFTNRLKKYIRLLLRKTSRTLSNSSDPPMSPKTITSIESTCNHFNLNIWHVHFLFLPWSHIIKLSVIIEKIFFFKLKIWKIG